MKKILFFSSGIFLFLICIALWRNAQPRQVYIGNQKFVLSIADTPGERQRGLQGRAHLAETEGMMFVFDEAGQYTFWMKDTLIPLDMVWVREGIVIDTTLNAQAPVLGTPDEQLPRFTSAEPADSVIELAAGAVERFGIEIGDTVFFR